MGEVRGGEEEEKERAWARRRRLHGNRTFKAHFQIVFACGALNVLRYQICAQCTTPYRAILPELKTPFRERFIGAKFSAAALKNVISYKLLFLNTLRPRQSLAQLSPDAFSNIACIVKIHDLAITIQSPRMLHSLRPLPRHRADQHRCLC